MTIHNSAKPTVDPVRKNQSKYVDIFGVLRYSADGSIVFPGPTGVRKF